jgi:hypothetical protein
MLNVEVFKPLQAYQAKLALHLYQGFKLWRENNVIQTDHLYSSIA